MDSKDAKQQYNLLLSNLDIVFNSNELKTYLASNKDFQKIILNQISILNSFEEEIKIKDTKALSFLSELVKISKDQYKTLEVSIKDKVETLDNINYLNIYIENIYKKHLSCFKEVKNNEMNSTELKNNSNNLENSNNSTNYTNKSNSNFFNRGGFFSPYGIQSQKSISPNELKENYFFDLAYKQVIEDINTGVFYLYDSKPKIIPILKKIYYLFSFLTGLSILISLIISFILLASPNLNFNIDGKNVVVATVTLPILIYSLILSSFFCYFGLKNLFKQPRNDNDKYFFDKRWGILIGFVSVLLLLYTLIPSIRSLMDDNLWLQLKQYNPTLENIVDLNKILFISEIVYFCFIVSFFIFGIIISFFNPRRDDIRMNEKLKTYVEKFKNEDIFK